MAETLLEVRGLTKTFVLRDDLLSRAAGATQMLRAVDNIDFALTRGETLSLVGESGCGKSTTARLVSRLVEPTAGAVLLNGEDILAFSAARSRQVRKTMQLVFQDPYSSLNPRKTVMQILSRPLIVHGLAKGWAARRRRVLELLSLVGLSELHADRYPHEFSGGQRQRIAIARALAVDPQIIIADEPVSALDVSIQAQILNLLRDLQERLGLTYLFIAHDLSVVRHISDRVAVMYLGKMVEIGDVDDIFERPRHPYTQALLKAVPLADPDSPPPELTLSGEVASPIDPPPGCRLCRRCPLASKICAEVAPALRRIGSAHHHVACHNV